MTQRAKLKRGHRGMTNWPQRQPNYLTPNPISIRNGSGWVVTRAASNFPQASRSPEDRQLTDLLNIDRSAITGDRAAPSEQHGPCRPDARR